MASIAERRRNRKSRNVNRRADGVANDNDGAAVAATSTGKPKRERRDDGVDYLVDKGRLNRNQSTAARLYGSLYRTALISGAQPLKSCLDIQEVRGGGGAGMPTTDLENAAWIAEAKQQLQDAQAALGFHSGMIAVCDLICGRGLRPREITDVQRETEEIETGLRLALDLLARHFQGREIAGEDVDRAFRRFDRLTLK